MTMTRTICLTILLLVALACAAAAGKIVPGEALVLDSLPLGPADTDAPFGITSEFVRCIDPGTFFPEAGDKVTLVPGRAVKWSRTDSDDGAFVFENPGVVWLTARLELDRWAEVVFTVEADAPAKIFVAGEEGEDELTLDLGRGRHRVSVRIEVADEPLTLKLSANLPDESGAAWTLDRKTAVTDFAQTAQLGRTGPLAVAPDGRLVARRYSRRNETDDGQQRSLDVLDAGGHLVASDVGGPSARPLRFTDDGKSLFIERGSDLLLWTAPAGPTRMILADEEGRGLTRLSPDGRMLLFASTRGADWKQPEDDEAARRQELRERVSDFTPRPHLHLLDVESGARRRLTLPGDHVLDDAAFLPDGKRVIYSRTVAIDERPWFESELRVIDLATGTDTAVAGFVAGWEVRPQALAPHPEGRRVAFLSSPEEIGGGRAEHNVYNRQVWLLDLETGEFERISRDLPWAFEPGIVAWDADGKGLLLTAHRGSRPQVAHLLEGKSGWFIKQLNLAGEAVGATALAPDASAIAYTASDPTTPNRLYLLTDPEKNGGKTRQLEARDMFLEDEWFISEPADIAVTGPDGDEIEAWWYGPSQKIDEGPAPLIVYYYGGSSPTSRYFNTTHQFLAANGYAVLVVNPRGASGYGDEFADHHAGDWGPKASSDILAAVDALLAAAGEQVDASRIGCYGGSYGGFMTEYLVTVTGRFGAAVSMYGIADLATYWGQGDWGWTYGDMANGGATPWTDADLFAQSPLWHADRITTPLLLLHGSDDTNVTPGQSEELFTALRTQNKPVELVLFPGEGHGISGSFENRVDHRNMMVWWYDKWLRDQPGSWEARWH